MRKLRILVVGAVLSLSTAGLTATPAHACMGEICEAINVVCTKVLKGSPCVK